VSAGDFQRIGWQRLHPSDLYHMIDWLREGWEHDEHDVAVQLARLKWHLLEIPERFHERALHELETLGRARIVAGVPWEPALANLRRLVSEWARSRKAAA
jgi:hypothetical protein